MRRICIKSKELAQTHSTSLLSTRQREVRGTAASLLHTGRALS
jgi:hypothetical protein